MHDHFCLALYVIDGRAQELNVRIFVQLFVRENSKNCDWSTWFKGFILLALSLVGIGYLSKPLQRPDRRQQGEEEEKFVLKLFLYDFIHEQKVYIPNWRIPSSLFFEAVPYMSELFKVSAVCVYVCMYLT